MPFRRVAQRGATQVFTGKQGWGTGHWLRWGKDARGATDCLQYRCAVAASSPDVPVQIRGRPHLPDSHNTLLPETLNTPRADLPKGVDFVEKPADATRCGELVREQCDAHLNTAGALYFSTPMRTAEEFDEFMEATNWRTDGDNEFAKFMNARSMTSTCVSSRVRTASDDHHLYTIEPHHEYHTAGFPHKIILFCADAPPAGGEWIVGDGRSILRDLDEKVVADFESKGVRYTVFYPSKHGVDGDLYNNWEDNVMPTKDEVEAYLQQLGYDWRWGEDESLTYFKDFPAIREHPITGERVFFNQIHAHHRSFYECHPLFHTRKGDPAMAQRWPVHVTFSDGSEIPQDTLDHMRSVIWKNCVGVRPTPGDVIVYDNWATLHGRIGWTGSQGDRKVYVSATFGDN